MGELSKLFPPTPSSAIASYSYPDIDEGTGVIIYYGFSTNEGGTEDFPLTPNILYSNDQFQQASEVQDD